ncbi:MAG TPA: type VI secretion system baseplate subunit TssG [Longimicrobiaceae bacterium]
MEDARVKARRVEDALRGDATSFGFFQAVRALERLLPGRAPVGRFADPADEVVRFSVDPTISFPASEILSLEIPEGEGEAARMSVRFLGLTGPQGVLPYHYTLLAAERRRARDGALGAFLDLFQHRALSLFYRAWEKHRPAVAHEKGEEDRVGEHLLDLAGMGLPEARGRTPVPAGALAAYAGLLAPQPRGAVALEQLLEDFFGVAAEVEQFVGGWYRLPPRDQCALGDEESASARLGLGAVAGDEVWDQQTRVRVRLGPLPRSRFDDFLPTGGAHVRLRELLRFWCHDQFELELQLVLARDDVPACVLGADEEPQPLGWTTWMRSAPFARDADDTILTLQGSAPP